MNKWWKLISRWIIYWIFQYVHQKRQCTDLHKHAAFAFCPELVCARSFLQLFLLVKQTVVPVHSELVPLAWGRGHGYGNGSFWIVDGSTVLSEGLECYYSILFTERERTTQLTVNNDKIIKTESGLKNTRHLMNKITCVEEKPP